MSEPLITLIFLINCDYIFAIIVNQLHFQNLSRQL
jgi:hypothetical protein